MTAPIDRLTDLTTLLPDHLLVESELALPLYISNGREGITIIASVRVDASGWQIGSVVNLTHRSYGRKAGKNCILTGRASTSPGTFTLTLTHPRKALSREELDRLGLNPVGPKS